jgi:TrpR family trp operon transcriptional repressor
VIEKRRPPLKKDDAWKGLLKLFLNADSEERMHELLELFFTISEKESLKDRYEIIKYLLMSEKPQRMIAEDLRVSIAKITAGSNELKRTSEELKDFLREQML